jgi:hypothetical protein
MRTHIQEFTAHDANGRNYTLHVYQEWHEQRGFDGKPERVKSLKAIETSNGDAVNRNDKGRYHLVVGEVPLTSDDPDAP